MFYEELGLVLSLWNREHFGKEEAKEDYREGHLETSHLDIKGGGRIDGGDYSGRVYCDIDFSGLNICGGTFTECIYIRSTFRNCNITGCRFIRCGFANSDFRFSVHENTEYIDCQIKNAVVIDQHGLSQLANDAQVICGK